MRRSRLLTLLTFWHLLSLDAPTVATLWTAFLAASCGVVLPAGSLVAMFLAVWTLYAADRLLDASPLHRQPTAASALELRHLFHHRHARVFLIGIGLVSAVLALLVPGLNPAALRLDLALGSLLIGYFVLIHATAGTPRLPKEIAVGLFFSAAVFIPTFARRPDLALRLAPLELLFSALCSLNCLCIYAWEHSPVAPAPHWLTRFAVERLNRFAYCILFAALALAAGTRSLAALAIALSALALRALHLHHRRLAPITLRATADLVLLTPLLTLPWL